MIIVLSLTGFSTLLKHRIVATTLCSIAHKIFVIKVYLISIFVQKIVKISIVFTGPKMLLILPLVERKKHVKQGRVTQVFIVMLALSS